MSNYQEGQGSREGMSGPGIPPNQETRSSGYQGDQGNQGGGSYQGDPGTYQGDPGGSGQYDTQQFPPSGRPGDWQGQSGYSGQGHNGPSGGRSHNPLSSHGARSINVRSSFKTTEFWVLIVVSLALLIAAAVTDRGDDLQGFGAHDAWKYITWLAVAYILSRGLTKLAGHERDDHRNHDHH